MGKVGSVAGWGGKTLRVVRLASILVWSSGIDDDAQIADALNESAPQLSKDNDVICHSCAREIFCSPVVSLPSCDSCPVNKQI